MNSLRRIMTDADRLSVESWKRVSRVKLEIMQKQQKEKENGQ